MALKECVELDCDGCDITLKLRFSVSAERMREIARDSGWVIDFHMDKHFCPICSRV